MWIIQLFLCVSAILRNNAQELSSFETQTATETSYTNSVVNGDTTRPPVTLSIRSGRKGNVDRSITPNPDQPSMYTETWKLMLMPIDFNRNRGSDSYVNRNEWYGNRHIVPLIRPDLQANNTVPAKLEDRNVVLDNSVPILYFQNNLTSDTLTNSKDDEIYAEALPNESIFSSAGIYPTFDLYRNPQILPGISEYSSLQSSLNSNAGNLKSDVEQKEVSSSSLKTSNSDLIVSRTNEDIIKPEQTQDLRTEQIPTPMDFYRNQRFLPPVISPYFSPYPFLPFQREGAFQPILPYLPHDQVYDREIGSAVNERIQQSPEEQILPQVASDQLVENLPIETSASVVPQQSLPFPAGRYPFGLYPPPYAFPLPNVPQSGFPLSQQVPQPRSVQAESTIVDPARPLPITPNVVPEVLPADDTLIPEEQTSVITDSEANPEEVVPVEEPDLPKTPYEFGFDMSDGKGNDQFRKEVSDISGVVTGSYGFKGADGLYRKVLYIADKFGYRAFMQSNEPGVASSSSADVVVMAERPPPNVIAETRKESKPEIIAVPDVNADLIASGSVPEIK